MTDQEPPKLDCPECREPLIPAQARGRHDRDGNFIEHIETCRCRWCGWLWLTDQEPVLCSCGTVARIDVDDGAAYAVEVKFS